MNLIEFDAAIKAHLLGWNPVHIAEDNQPAETKGLDEYIRFAVIHGNGFIDEPAGVYSVNGSTVLHPFVLQFDVYTKLNTDTMRNNELCQAVLDKWQVYKLGIGLDTIGGSIERIGEEGKHFRQAVSVEGRREEFLTAR